MAEIRGLPEVKDYPGANPLRIKTLRMLRSMASDPTALEVTPLVGLARGMKGIKVHHGFRQSHWKSDVDTYMSALNKAEKELIEEYGKGWYVDAPEGELQRRADIYEKAAEKEAQRLDMFDYFEESKAGTGAGGNLYGEGIYFSEHPRISRGYGSRVRRHNIPPQAKILDVAEEIKPNDLVAFKEFIANKYGMSLERFEEIYGGKEIATVEDIINKGWIPRRSLRDLLTSMGYDGLSYKAGQMSGLPPGVPEGTKNYVIYNYDVINNPRKYYPKTPSPADRPLLKLRAREQALQRRGRPGPMESGEMMPMSRKGPISPTEVTPFEQQQLTPKWLSNQMIDKPWNKTRLEAIEEALKQVLKTKE